MATVCEIRVQREPGAESLALDAINEVRRIESKYSRYRNDSAISAINQSAGKAAVRCDPETMALLQFASHMFRLSDGLFDLTSGILRNVWRFHRSAQPQGSCAKQNSSGHSAGVAPPSDHSAGGDQIPPARAEVDRLLPYIGWHRVELTDSNIRLPLAGMELDFGGIGKEYAADRARQILYAGGIRSAMVDLGGDLSLLGSKPDGSPWTLAIRDPRATDKILATLPMQSGALATSGDYERCIVHKGIRYCHILNPKTGWPCQYWRSVSVAAGSCLLCGALASIAMLKEREAIAFLKQQKASWLCVGPDGLIYRG